MKVNAFGSFILCLLFHETINPVFLLQYIDSHAPQESQVDVLLRSIPILRGSQDVLP